MNCNELHTHIFSYLEQSVSKDINKRIKLHLESCEKCSMLVQDISSTFDCIEQEKKEEPSISLENDIILKINNQSRGRYVAMSKILKPLTVAAMLMLGIFLGQLVSKIILSEQEQVVVNEEVYLNDINNESIGYYLINVE